MPQDPLSELIKKTQNIGLIIHEKPDGDAISSCAALRLALIKLRKNPILICKNSIPENFKFLPGTELVEAKMDIEKLDLIIIVDCGNLSRSGFLEELNHFSLKKSIINIDHHPKNDVHQISKINIIDYNATATVEIIESILHRLNVSIDKDIATCLLTGLYTDTGGFKHSNTRPNTLLNASKCLKKGAKLRLISDNLTNSRSIKSLKLLGTACMRLKIHQEFKLALSAITQSDFNNTNANSNEVNGIVNYLANLAEVSTVILFFQIDDNLIRATVRNKNDKVDMLKLASIFGGRGQKEASGFTFEGKIVANNQTWNISYE